MLESVFVIIMAMGFVLFILGIAEKSIVYSGTSILMWVILLAAYLYVEVPTDDSTYTEPAVFALAIAFIFINAIWMIILYMKNQFEESVP